MVDRCRQIGLNVTEVQFGAKSDRAPIGQDRATGYANKRAEIWGNMREWLRTATIDNDPELIADLIGVEFGYVLRDGRDAIQLERKEDMKRRGLASPDNGDALALTFAYPVLASGVAAVRAHCTALITIPTPLPRPSWKITARTGWMCSINGGAKNRLFGE